MDHGYSAQPRKIQQHGRAAAEEVERIHGVLRDVREAFVAAGRPMGDDQYGAEMEKSYPVMRDDIFNAFNAYLDELDGVGEGLHVTGATYRAAEHPET
ncbi:hypothetical protein OHA77_17020 [Streptosporangium sp. NBC_01639]|uniref:hypothetical protein n=1 Tax=Streptosporangium sp. NBC_01639 TaxID=2975948 RepID=UPI00386F56C3|nr:hypothetical protein OHA77_17020 [Streptosporangium sp. NBC_01639]